MMLQQMTCRGGVWMVCFACFKGCVFVNIWVQKPGMV
jgi:hypothetical protein